MHSRWHQPAPAAAPSAEQAAGRHLNRLHLGPMRLRRTSVPCITGPATHTLGPQEHKLHRHIRQGTCTESPPRHLCSQRPSAVPSPQYLATPLQGVLLQPAGAVGTAAACRTEHPEEVPCKHISDFSAEHSTQQKQNTCCVPGYVLLLLELEHVTCPRSHHPGHRHSRSCCNSPRYTHNSAASPWVAQPGSGCF